MRPGFSLYLDLIRFTASFAVFVAHLCSERFTGGLLWRLQMLGMPAVTVFFVLSGFVIGWAARGPQMNGRRFALDRAARILSVSVPAVVATVLLDRLGARLNPTAYAAVDTALPTLLREAAAALLFLDGSWTGYVGLGSNVSYWSLPFEVWYYVVFGLFCFMPSRWRLAASGAALVVAGPRIAMLFPIWLLGVACQHLCRRLPSSPRAGAALLAGTLLAGGLALGWMLGWVVTIPAYPWRPPTEIGPDLVVGAGFALHLLGAWLAAPALHRALGRFERPIRWAAANTFTLYLFHIPVLMLLHAVSPWPVSSWANRGFLFCGTLAAVAVLAQLTERQRNRWRGWLARGLERMRRPAAPLLAGGKPPL